MSIADVVSSTAERFPDVSWGVSIRKDGNAVVEQQADRVLPTASMGKVFLLLAAARAVHSHERSPQDLVELIDSSRVADSGLWQYLTEGQLSLESACVLVASVSDNSATNALIDLLGLAAVERESRELAMPETRLVDRIRDHRTQRDPVSPSLSRATDLSRLMFILATQVSDEGFHGQVARWLELNVDLSLVASAFGLDPLAHNDLAGGNKFLNKTGTDLGVRADAGALKVNGTVWTYAAIANWKDEVSVSSLDVLAAMREIGESIRDVASFAS